MYFFQTKLELDDAEELLLTRMGLTFYVEETATWDNMVRNRRAHYPKFDDDEAIRSLRFDRLVENDKKKVCRTLQNLI